MRGRRLFPRPRRPRLRWFDRQAFTLIEVLVAIVILSTGIVLVLRAFDTSMVALSEARDSLWTSLLIRDRVARAAVGILQQCDGGQGPSRGVYELPSQQQYEWNLHATREDDLGGIPRQCGVESNVLMRVTVDVRCRGTGRWRGSTTYVRYRRDEL